MLNTPSRGAQVTGLVLSLVGITFSPACKPTDYGSSGSGNTEPPPSHRITEDTEEIVKSLIQHSRKDWEALDTPLCAGMPTVSLPTEVLGLRERALAIIDDFEGELARSGLSKLTPDRVKSVLEALELGASCRGVARSEELRRLEGRERARSLLGCSADASDTENITRLNKVMADEFEAERDFNTVRERLGLPRHPVPSGRVVLDASQRDKLSEVINQTHSIFATLPSSARYGLGVMVSDAKSEFEKHAQSVASDLEKGDSVRADAFGEILFSTQEAHLEASVRQLQALDVINSASDQLDHLCPVSSSQLHSALEVLVRENHEAIELSKKLKSQLEKLSALLHDLKKLIGGMAPDEFEDTQFESPHTDRV